MDAPINRLAATIYEALLHEIKQRARDGGLVIVAHRQIGIIPSAEDSQSLEIPLVLLHVTRCKFPAESAKFRRGNFPFSAKFLFHLRLDRQPVAIPTRHVRRVMPCHAPGLDDHVFQNFIEAGAQMNCPRRIRRPVMQNKQRKAFSRSKDPLVKMRILPCRKLLWLILRESRLHRKISFWQV